MPASSVVPICLHIGTPCVLGLLGSRRRIMTVHPTGSTKERRGLGRGLEVLLGEAGQPELVHLPVETIHPNPRQPRRRFEPEAAAGLASSIRLQGVLQPIVVRRRDEGGFELIAGERRWRAARGAGVATLPAVVRDVGDRDSLLLGLVENVAREQLSPVEEARAYASLVDEFELSLGDVADRVGRSKSAVSNRLRLLELPEEVLWMLARGDMSEGHARAVLSLPDDDARRLLARRIVKEGLTVRAAERAAQEGGARRRPRRGAAAVDPALVDRARAAAEALTGMPSRVAAGTLQIRFEDEKGLAELVEALEVATTGLLADRAA
jgi:ParB family transcriptional regulator, chromosome partitioning protein